MNEPAPPDLRYRLPLFPLPVVLLPDTQMPLHIFEQRYRDMVRDALESDRRFGMVYHDWDRQGPFLSEEGRVGCVAQIAEHQALEDGRSLILIDGVERFSIVDGIESDTLYFEALVTRFDDEADASDGAETSGAADLVARRRRSIDLFEAVLDTLPSRPDRLPNFAADADISFRLAQTIQVDPRWHQELLEMRSEGERLARLDEVFEALLD